MHIETILGPVATESIQRVLPHEHLLSFTPGPWLSGGPNSVDEDKERQIDLVVTQLREISRFGFNMVVDLSPYGVVGRDAMATNVELLAEISRRSKVHIVLGTSIYLEAFSPEWLRQLSRKDLAKLFIRDLTEGMGGTRYRASLLGEQATGLDEITEFEKRCLLASCDAHKETGASIFTHTSHGSMALEQVEIFRRESVPLESVVIGHMDIQPDSDYTRRVLDSGVSVAFDTIGKQYWEFFLSPKATPQQEGEFPARFYFRSDESRIDLLLELVDEGFVHQILLAQDLTGAEAYLNPATHGTWGLNYLGGSFLPRLRERGLSEDHIDTLTRSNPLRVIGQQRHPGRT